MYWRQIHRCNLFLIIRVYELDDYGLGNYVEHYFHNSSCIFWLGHGEMHFDTTVDQRPARNRLKSENIRMNTVIFLDF